MAQKATSPIDPEVLGKMQEETASILAQAPTFLPPGLGERVAEVAAAEATAHPQDPNDPEDNTLLLKNAFAALGRPVPPDILDRVAYDKKPVVADEVGAPVELEMTFEQYQAQQRKNRKTYAETMKGIGTKRANYLAALQRSPKVVYQNRKDRRLLINSVAIAVPEGSVTIPALLANHIANMDRTERWAQAEARRAQQFLNIEGRQTSFVPDKVRAFSIQ